MRIFDNLGALLLYPDMKVIFDTDYLDFKLLNQGSEMKNNRFIKNVCNFVILFYLRMFNTLSKKKNPSKQEQAMSLFKKQSIKNSATPIKSL